MVPEIRPYRLTDGQALCQLFNDRAGGGNRKVHWWEDYLAGVLARDGRIWTQFIDDQLVGFALIDPVPALNGLYELQGRIAAKVRRQGLGRQLLGWLLADLKGSPVKQIGHPVNSLTSEAALFLLSQGFFIEHQEIRMVLPSLSHLPPARLPAGFYLQTFSTPLAISLFRQLYEDSFRKLPWYQPYLSDQEVSTSLADSADLLFLMHGDRPVGLAWLRWPVNDSAQIEPFGLIALYQGRGLSRPFLRTILNQAKERGARQVILGVWQDNKAAIHLYQKAGFRPTFTTTYLAHNIESETHVS